MSERGHGFVDEACGGELDGAGGGGSTVRGGLRLFRYSGRPREASKRSAECPALVVLAEFVLGGDTNNSSWPFVDGCKLEGQVPYSLKVESGLKRRRKKEPIMVVTNVKSSATL